MSEVTDLKYKLADLTDRVADIVIELSELKTELNKPEPRAKPWPQVGDEYWCVDDEGDVIIEEYGQYHTVDRYRLATGNYHRTEAEALAYSEWQADPRVVARAMIERMEGFKSAGPYRIAHTPFGAKELTVVSVTGITTGGLEFDTPENARYIVRKHPDLCKVALGVITDKEEAGRIVREAMGK